MNTTREAPGLRVPRAQAESARRILHERGLLERTLSPAGTDDGVWFPVVAGDALLDEVVGLLSGATVGRASFPVRPERAGDYTTRLEDLPADVRAMLPTSFDVVGRIAVIKLPAAASLYAERVGAALLDTHPHLETVALDRGVKGELRVRELAVVAGAPSLVTTHREHGLEIEITLDKAYFSPRLATERQRLAARIAPGARVLDLFAGVGAFVCLVARTREPAQIHAIDLNPHAVHLLHRNLARNKVDASRVTVAEGDARALAPRTRDWDHVVMNLPHDATAFLDIAAACVAPHGEIHLYAMVERSDRAAFEADLEAKISALLGAPWHIADVRHVRNYSPTSDGLGYTLSAA